MGSDDNLGTGCLIDYAVSSGMDVDLNSFTTEDTEIHGGKRKETASYRGGRSFALGWQANIWRNCGFGLK
jgi:hypothetical protein